MTTFHRWIGTGDTVEVYTDPWSDVVQFPVDQCLTCGVYCPDTGTDAQSDHECLPLGCPGTDVPNPHTFALHTGWSSHFTGTDGRIVPIGGWTLYCERCGYKVDQHTAPSDMQWDCQD